MVRLALESAHESSGRFRTLRLFSSLALLALFAGWFAFSYGYLEDDAFIHLVFARSVSAGRGFSFGGLVTNGDTAPLWVLVLCAIHTLGVGWTEAAKLACALGLTGAVLAVWRVAFDLAPDEKTGWRLALGAVAATVVNPFFLGWTFAGMESVTAMGASLWVIWAAFLGKATWTRLACAAVLLGAGPLLRPELLLLDAIAGPVVLWRAWQLSRGGPQIARLGQTAILAATMALPLAIWCAYALHAFGSVVPNTNLAKRGGSVLELAPRLASVYLAGFPVTVGLLPYAAANRMWKGGKLPAAVWVLLLWPLLCIGFYLADHTVVQTRYSVLSMPSMSIAILFLIDDARRPWLWRTTLGAMVLASLVTVWLALIPHVENKKDCVRAFAAVSEYLRSNVPPSAPVAVYAIGQIEFQTRHPLVDIGGITRPAVIPFLNDLNQTVKWAQAQGATYYIGGAAPEPGAVLLFSTSLPFLGWTFSPSRWRTLEPLSVYRLPAD